jgi:hypothetical protein
MWSDPPGMVSSHRVTLWPAMTYAPTPIYAIPREVVRRTRRGSLRLPVEAMAARAAWLVGKL